MKISKRFARREAFANGYRSKFEYDFSKKLKELKLKVEYESEKISYIQPEKVKKYCPDWKIKDGVFIETKGRFTAADRQKILWVRESNPKSKVYLLFQQAENTLSKKSRTTYRQWCEKHNIICADIKETKVWTKWFTSQGEPC